MRNEALAIVQELKDRYPNQRANGYDIAEVYVGLAERDQAFAWLEKDFQARNTILAAWLYQPPLNSLREDPRFKDLAKRIGMPELK